MKTQIVTEDPNDQMKDTSFEDFNKQHSDTVFVKNDGFFIEKKEMFLIMGGTLPA